jgi:hypothetical protein
LIALGGLVGVSAGVTAPGAVAVAPSLPGPGPHPAAGVAPLGASAPEKERDDEGPRLSDGVWDLAAGDLDGDERPDLAVVTGGPGSLTGRVSLLFDPGVDVPPSSWPSVSFATTGDYGRVAIGDIDGDGVEDVAALTFGTHVLRWWLLTPDHAVREERSMSFAGAALPGRTCPGPGALSGSPPTLASLAFADLDADGSLELAVIGYAGAGEGGLYLMSYRHASGCFELSDGAARATRGSLKVRFFDVDDDGALDIVTSHYALARPSASASDCRGECLEWGEWWRRGASAPTPLVARFGNRELSSADPAPELNVVDFDALRTPAGVRFALAGSAHLCPARDCWIEGHAGFVSVVDGQGHELRSSEGWKQRVEQAPPVAEARLLPRVLSFTGDVERPSLAAGHWWGTRSKNSACSRVSACAGPLTLDDAGTDWGLGGTPAQSANGPRVLATETFAQAIGVLAAAGAAIEHERHCGPSKPLLTLPDISVTSIIELRSNGRPLRRADYSWAPGRRDIVLASAVARETGETCVVYSKSARERLAVADSKQGLVVLPP